MPPIRPTSLAKYNPKHHPKGTADRYSARRTARSLNFVCRANGAGSVFLVGDFNFWNPTSMPMKRQPDGNWMVQAQLTHGHHQYYFLVDGRPELDPLAQGTTRNWQGEKVSVVAIS
jgi:1,4-alpha-glucan branching enzyme